MPIDAKLQLKANQTIAIVEAPGPVDVAAPHAEPAAADVVLVFATNAAELDERADMAVAAAQRAANTWIAYPKAKQLGTDLSRDIVRERMNRLGLDTVRAVSIDDTWTGLRFKPLA